MLLLLGNVVPLWETMLAAMKLGVVVIPAAFDYLRAESIDGATAALTEPQAAPSDQRCEGEHRPNLPKHGKPLCILLRTSQEYFSIGRKC